MQSDIVASCVTVAARLSASVTHDTPSRFPLAGIISTHCRVVSPAFQTSGINLRCFQGLVTLLAIPPHSSSWVSFFLRSLRPAYFTYFLLSSLVHDQGRKERQEWAFRPAARILPSCWLRFLHASFRFFYDWIPVACIHCNYSSIQCLRSIITKKSCRCCRNQIMLLLSPLTVDLVSSFSDFPSFFWQINS